VTTPRRSGDDQPDASESVAGQTFDDILRQLPATMWTTDRRLALTFVRGALVRRLNIEPSTIVGRTLPDLLLDGREDHPLIQAHIAALDGHETAVRVEWGGNLYSARVAPLRDAAGDIAGCVGTQQIIGWLPDDDLTVRESEVRLQRIIDCNLAGIAFGDDQGRITDANEAFLQIAGYSRDELDADGISWPSLMPIELHQRQVEALQEILTTGRCTPFESEIIRPDGSRVHVVVSAARLSVRKREGVAFVVDVSPYRLREEWVRAELAAADVLLEAPPAESATASILAILCDRLGWRSAWLWRGADAPRPSAHHGCATVNHSALAALAADAATTRQSFWSAGECAMAIPVSANGQPWGSIVLVDATAHGPEPPRVAATTNVVARLAKYLGATAQNG